MRTATIVLLTLASIFRYASIASEQEIGAITVSGAPTSEEICSYPGLPHALLPARLNGSPEDRALVGMLLNALATAKEGEVLPLLGAFVERNATSPWNAAIKVNLAYIAFQKGYFTKAMAVSRDVWETHKSSAIPEVRLLAESAGVEYALMLARVGRMEELQAVTKELESRQFSGTNWSKLQSAREGLWAMTNRPGVSFRCGPYAVLNVAEKVKGRRDAAWLKNIKSPREGFSLKEVGKMAESQGLKWQMALRRSGASVIVPSVVHWKLNHYGALLEEKGGKYLLKDPTFKVEQWIDGDVLDQEASGYFLVPSGALPVGWTKVSSSEASNIYGKGHSGHSDDGETRDCSRKNGGKCGEKGMAGYQFHALLASLTVNDIPIWVDSAWGPDIEMEVTYNQREMNESDTISFTSFGPQWESPYFAYLTEDPSDPLGNVTMYYGNGGRRVMSHASSTWRDGVDTVTYERLAAGNYVRLFGDGSKEIYNHPVGTITPRKVFLSQIVDPQGNAVTINYDSPTGTKISSIVNAAGERLQFFYGLAGHQYIVTRILDPRGREANFEYSVGSDSKARLTRITDPMGLASEFEYDTSGTLNALKTPYGTTKFRSGTPNTPQGLIRWIEATDPHGDTERLEYNLNAEASGVATTVPPAQLPSASNFSVCNADLDDRTTFYWDKKAWAEAPGECSKAKLIHWLQVDEADNASGIAESEKEPFESRVWYNYPGQDDASRYKLGDLSLPSAVARQVENETGATVTQIVRREYDNPYGNLTKIIDPKGRETLFEYAEDGIDLRYIKQWDVSSGTWVTLREIEYSPTTHRPSKIYDASRYFTTLTYNARKQVGTVTNAKNQTQTYVYYETPGSSNYGRLKEVRGPANELLASFVYDGFGRVQMATDASQYTLMFAYDALDRVTHVTYPDQTLEEARYERMDLAVVVDRLKRVTHFTYNGLGQLVATTDPLEQVTQYEWCRCGSLKRIIDGNGNSTRWKRDVQGRVTAKVYADGRTETLAYEPLSGRLSSFTDAASPAQTTTYRYYLDSRLHKITYAGAVSTPETTFMYDDFLGRIATMNDASIGTTAYTYYPVSPTGGIQAGALQAQSIDGPLTGNIDALTFTYDEIGRVNTRVDTAAGHSMQWVYDALGRLSQLVTPQGPTDYSYVGASGRIDYSINHSMRHDFEYFEASGDFRLKWIAHSREYYNPGPISKFEFTYRTDGIIDSIKRSLYLPTSVSTYELGHDATGQIATAALRDGGGQIQHSYSYGYDAAGNRISAEKDAVFTRWSVDPVNQLTGQAGGGLMRVAGSIGKAAHVTLESSAAPLVPRPAFVDSQNRYEGWVDVNPGTSTVTVKATDFGTPPTSSQSSWNVNVSGGASKSFSYDNNGNLTSDGTRTFTWDVANRMKSVTVGGQTYSWDYDGKGRRIRERLNNVIQKQWVWSGFERLVELNAAGTVTRRYYPDGEQQVEFGSNPNVYYNRDHLGSIREVLDETQNLVARYDYDLWGARTPNQVTVNPRETDIGFTGHPLHSGTGLYLAPFRAYDPNLARWINRDPIGENGGLNLYGYVENNPLNFEDPLGLNPARVQAFARALAKARATRSNRSMFMCPRSVRGSMTTRDNLWSRGPKGDALKNIQSHWKNHRSEFPEYSGPKDYVQGAHRELTYPSRNSIIRRDNNGDIGVYNPDNNTLTVCTRDGVPKTHYRPDPSHPKYVPFGEQFPIPHNPAAP